MKLYAVNVAHQSFAPTGDVRILSLLKACDDVGWNGLSFDLSGVRRIARRPHAGFLAFHRKFAGDMETMLHVEA
jgi:hypothetical protein